MNLYSEKDVGYFSNARTDIEPLLPAKSSVGLRALEIGCSGGHTLAWLKKAGYCNWVAGVEPYTDLAVSGGVIDQFFKLDIEKELPDIAEHSIDLLLCLDVLEHLVNPWEAIRRLDRLLKPGGTLIVSVPNLRNYHIIANLAFRGQFTYTDSGTLDRTHLRFFTRESAIELAQTAGAKLTALIGTETDRWQKRLLTRLGLGDLLAKQFLLSARKPTLASPAGFS
jgi:2-polyprenyl-3-methyl-5-hydroxy-6-metoxy-1,4-benzoquinol methylase